jgi:predicted lipid-binding transport protein (Tim44 family)
MAAFEGIGGRDRHAPPRYQTPPANFATEPSPLSNWPRYPGGAIAGALIGIASVVLFFIGIPALRSVLPVALVIAVVLWVLRSCRSDD